MEDLSVAYDMTVRDVAKNILQFTYGDDNLDPKEMESENSQLLDLDDTLKHIKCILPLDPNFAPNCDKLVKDEENCEEIINKVLSPENSLDETKNRMSKSLA